MVRWRFCILVAGWLALAWWAVAPVQAQTPQQDDPIFVESSLDKPQVWQGEALAWEFYLWRCVQLYANPEYVPPAVSGFLTLDQDQGSYIKTFGGREYLGSRLAMWLIPQQVGKQTIGSASIRVPRSAFSMNAQMVYADFFDRMFSSSNDTPGSSSNTSSFSKSYMGFTFSFNGVVTSQQSIVMNGGSALLSSNPLTVDVKPLPTENQPASFGGGVGQYTVAYNCSSEQGRVGEPLMLTMQVNGTGNVGLLEAPSVASYPGFRILDVRSEGGFDKPKPNRLAGQEPSYELPASELGPHGTRTFTTVVVPLQAGSASLKMADFSYFDPQDQKYHTIEGDTFKFEILPGSDSQQAEFSGLWPLEHPRLGGLDRLPAWACWMSLLPLLGIVSILAYRPLKPRQWRGAQAVKRRLQQGWELTTVFEMWGREVLGQDYSVKERSAVLASWQAKGFTQELAQRFEALAQELDRRRFAKPGQALSGDCAGELYALAQDFDACLGLGKDNNESLGRDSSADKAKLGIIGRLTSAVSAHFQCPRPKWLVITALVLASAGCLAVVGAWGQSHWLASKQWASPAQRGYAAWQAGQTLPSYAAYKQALDAGCRTSELLYNLGCVSTRLGDIARARAYIEAAQEAAPRNKHLSLAWDKNSQALVKSWHNQAQEPESAAAKSAEVTPTVQPNKRSHGLWGLPMSVSECWALWSVLALLGVLGFIQRRFKAALPVLAVALLVLLALAAQLGAPKYAVVVADNTPWRSDSALTSPELGYLRKGEEVQVLGIHGQWARVKLHDSRPTGAPAASGQQSSQSQVSVPTGQVTTDTEGHEGKAANQRAVTNADYYVPKVSLEAIP